MSTLEDWTATVVEALDLDPRDVDRDLVLDLARDVAHGVARPAAPLTAFLVGLAAGTIRSVAAATWPRRSARWPPRGRAAPSS